MRTYLTVPFSAAHRARALGARWDMARKSWFVPDGLDLKAFVEWLPQELRGWFGNLRARPTSRKSQATDRRASGDQKSDLNGHGQAHSDDEGDDKFPGRLGVRHGERNVPQFHLKGESLVRGIR